MRSYTNRNGDSIEVSKEHLDMSVRIKKELQKSSPSRRCSWALHKKLMEKEGFMDSENSESYRCMIKDYQRQVGELPEVVKYADMVADSKIESIKELVGEMAYEKRENQHVLKELNKVKRDVIDFTLLAEQIRHSFDNHDWSKIKFDYEPIISTGRKMIVCLSDLHIGALIDLDINKYNYEIAQARMQEYLNSVIADIELYGISDVYLMNLGDSIEHPYMHNLAYSCEFTLSEQIARASDIIIKFMVGLSKKANVTVAGIAGNHDRFNEDKNKNLDGDHAVKGINIAIQSFLDNAKPERITYEQAKDYEHSFSINGKNVLALHGDLDNKSDANLLSRHSSLKGIEYDIVIMGHYHTREIKEVSDNKFIIVNGSLKGTDNYSINKLRKTSSPSQTYIIVDESGNINVKWAVLKS